MSKIIIAPPQSFSPLAIHDRWALLFEYLNREFGFKMHKTTAIEGSSIGGFRVPPVAKDVDTVFLLVAPKFAQSDAIRDLIPKNAKLITYVLDIHGHGARFGALLERSDVILSGSDKLFRDKWPQFVDKFQFFPPYFSPTKRFTRFKTNTHPKMRCLLAGVVNTHYPIRVKIQQEWAKSGMVDVLPFPGTYGAKKVNAVTRDEFAALLHSYYCGVTSSVYGCVICKALEIPAVGALLLTDSVDDMEMMGFIPGKHYVPITVDNVMGQVDECLANPEKYRDIRMNGMEMVRSKHGFDTRMEVLHKAITGE